jgi:hypothetical protein
MIIASISEKAAEPFTPSWMEGQADAPKFWLRAGDVIERELMEAELAGAHGAGEVWPWELNATLQDGLAALGGEDGPQLVALAQTAATGPLEDPAEVAVLDQARAIVGQHYPPHQMLLAQGERRKAVLPILAFCRYCVRWENVDAEMRRGPDGLIDAAALRSIDPILLRSVGFAAYNLQYGVSWRKNSDAPLKSGADPKTSPSAEPSEKAGSSLESDTTKTLG